MGNRATSNQGESQGRTGSKWAQAGRPSPFRARFGAPFDLAAIQTIYSPLTKIYTSIHSSSAAEDQRREGHRSGEGRVEMVD
jgi:hypothetical protein